MISFFCVRSKGHCCLACWCRSPSQHTRRFFFFLYLWETCSSGVPWNYNRNVTSYRARARVCVCVFGMCWKRYRLQKHINIWMREEFGLVIVTAGACGGCGVTMTSTADVAALQMWWAAETSDKEYTHTHTDLHTHNIYSESVPKRTFCAAVESTKTVTCPFQAQPPFLK